jgi:ArsR family transcriptional regulator
MRDLEATFKALAEETRLRILALIFRHGPVCVCEVEGLLGVTQSKASRHLRYMANAGVLEAERDGVTMNYRVPAHPSPDLAAVLVLLRGLLAGRDTGDARAEAGALVQLRLSRGAANGAAAAAS